MTKRVILFDADGVLTIPEEFFSIIYSQEYGLDDTKFGEFFTGVFQEAIEGKADLKELIVANQDTWHWQGNIDDLLNKWFESENNIDQRSLAIVEELKQKQLPVYLATNQEKYRGEYFKQKMFPDMFDGYFISNELGYRKPDPKFFTKIIATLKEKHFDLKPQEIIFFDDTPSHVEGAKSVGIDAYLYESPDQARQILVGAKLL